MLRADFVGRAVQLGEMLTSFWVHGAVSSGLSVCLLCHPPGRSWAPQMDGFQGLVGGGQSRLGVFWHPPAPPTASQPAWTRTHPAPRLVGFVCGAMEVEVGVLGGPGQPDLSCQKLLQPYV